MAVHGKQCIRNSCIYKFSLVTLWFCGSLWWLMYLLFLYSHVFCLWPYGYLTVHRNNVFVCCSCIYMFFGLWPFGYVAVYGDQCTQCKEARQSHLPILAHGHTSLHHPSHERRWKTKKWQTKNFKKTAISQPNNQHQLVPLWPYACNHYSRLIKVVVIFVISLVYLLSFLPGVIISHQERLTKQYRDRRSSWKSLTPGDICGCGHLFSLLAFSLLSESFVAREVD